MALKVAVYAICRDEADRVEAFMACAAEADGVFVTDTGSADDTRERLQRLGASVVRASIEPWRFDRARNAALDAVPEDFDVCFSLDLDETASAGWRAEIERVWRADVHRVRYPYVWNTLPDGRDGVTHWNDRVHRRQGFRWVKPVHEMLQLGDGAAREVQVDAERMVVRHHRAGTGPRSAYLPLLELACREDPRDARSLHFLGREHFLLGQHARAIDAFRQHLALGTNTYAAAASMRYLGLCHNALGNAEDAQAWTLRACAEAPAEREPWVDLGTLMYERGNYAGAYFAMKQALAIREKPRWAICEPRSWGAFPWDIASLAAARMGMFEEALRLCEQAVAIEPGDARLANNIEFLRRESAVRP